MRRLIILSVIALLAVSTMVLAARKKKLRITGSTTVLPVARIAAEEFMNAHPEANITVRGGGSGVGIASLLEGMCDIADASRPIKDKELKKAISRGIDPVAHVIAMDGIAVIVHPSNRIKCLTKSQLKAIYTGKISNWKKVGGTDKEIVVISRDTASGTYEAFNKLALDKARVRPDALLAAANRAVAGIVAKTPGAVGYVGLGYVNKSVKAVQVDSIDCNVETVLSGDYPLSRPLFMYTNGKPSGLEKEFLDFVMSEDGQKLVEEVGFVGLK